MDGQNKNLFLAMVLSAMVILTWSLLFPPTPTVPAGGTGTETAADATVVPDAATAPETAASPEEIAVADAPRVQVDTPDLFGSISLLGGRIDDLSLRNYRDTIDPASANVHLFIPVGTEGAYYATFGYAAAEGLVPEAVPGPDTLWSIESGTVLTPSTPVTLVWNNGAGLIFHRTIAVDDKFMFTIDQSVTNTGAGSVAMRPYGLIRRHGEPDNLKKFFILHEGLIRMSDGTLQEVKYSAIEELDVDPAEGAPAERIEVQENGWVGFTDHYWMATLVPQQGTGFRSTAKYFPEHDIYQAEAVMPLETVGAGATASVRTQLFVGAQEWATIRDYQNDSGIFGFLDSIEYGEISR